MSKRLRDLCGAIDILEKIAITNTRQKTMAQLPPKRHSADATSIDDMRKISPAAMVVAAVLAILVMMAVVYLPKMWGIDPYGNDANQRSLNVSAPAQH